MDVVLVEIPKQEGNEQYGLRPALSISNPIKGISIIVPFTSNLLGLRFNHTLKIDPSLDNGLTSISILLGFQVRAIDRKRIIKVLGVLDEKYEIKVKETLMKTLNL